MELVLMNWSVGQVISFGFIRKASYGFFVGFLYSALCLFCPCSHRATTSMVLSLDNTLGIWIYIPPGSENNPIAKMRELYRALTATNDVPSNFKVQHRARWTIVSQPHSPRSSGDGVADS